MNRTAVIFDIDGTLADVSGRMKFLSTTPPDWGAYHGALLQDPVIVPMAKLYTWCMEFATIFVCTTRPEAYRPLTQQWFSQNALPLEVLMMRSPGDQREDADVKKDMLQKIRDMTYLPAFAVDDRDSNCEMYRAQGLACLQTRSPESGMR